MKNRKAFRFYRSYFDVAKELPETERLEFLWALLNKQFENIDPSLSGVCKFAYISQEHSIKAQVEGYLNKINNSTKEHSKGGTQGGTQGGSKAPSAQEKEKEKEKEKVQYVVDVNAFLNWFNQTLKHYKKVEGKFKTLNKTDVNNLKQLKQLNYTQTDWLNAFKAMYESKWVQDNKMCTPSHFLRNENFQKYVNQIDELKDEQWKPNWL
jgi:hypothetical protein